MSQRAGLLRAVQAAAAKGAGADLAAALANLDAHDRQRTAAFAQSRELDMAAVAVREALTPVPVHEHHTAATDWLGDYDPPKDYRPHMIAEASYWFKTAGRQVLGDREEFDEQARGRAYTVAGVYGDQALNARREFMSYVSFLASGGRRQAASGLPQIDQTVDPNNAPSPTPYPTEVFDNFAPEQDQFNAGVEGLNHDSQISSAQAPMFQQLQQMDSGGSGFGSGPERPDQHDESFDQSLSYAEVPLGPPGQIPAAAGPAPSAPSAAPGSMGNMQPMDQGAQQRQNTVQASWTGPDHEGFRWRARSTGLDALEPPYHVRCSSLHYPDQLCGRAGEHTASMAVDYAGDLGTLRRQASYMRSGYDEGMQVIGHARGELARVASHHDSIITAFKAEPRTEDEIAWLRGYLAAARPVLAQGFQACGCGQPARPGKKTCTACKQARQASKGSRGRLDFPLAAEAAHRKGAPFAGYEDFAACTKANADKDNPDAYCGYIKHKVEDKGKEARLIRMTASDLAAANAELRKLAASSLTQVQQTVSPDNEPTPEADQLPADVMFGLNPPFQGEMSAPVGTSKAAARRPHEVMAAIMSRSRNTWSAAELRFVADYMTRPHQTTDDLAPPYNSAQTTPEPFSVSMQGGDYQQGFQEGQEDRRNGERPTFSDVSSRVSPYVSGYAQGYFSGPAGGGATDVPGSMGGDSGQAQNAGEAARAFQVSKASLQRRARDFTEEQREDAAHSLGPEHKLPVDSRQDLKNAHIRAHQVEGIPEGTVDSYLDRLDDEYDYHPGKAAALVRVSSLFVTARAARSGDFIKGYRYAQHWRRGQRLVSLGSAEFEAGLFAGVCDRPGIQAAWVADHQRFGQRHPQLRKRMAAHASFTRKITEADGRLARRGVYPVLAARSRGGPEGEEADRCARCGAPIHMRDVGLSSVWSHGSERDNDHKAVFDPAQNKNVSFGPRQGGKRRTAATSTDLITDGPGTSPDPMGTTPLNGPGTPPPQAGGEDPARAGGPPPYQVVEPAGQGPVAPDDVMGQPQEAPVHSGPFTQTFSGRHPENAILAPVAPNDAAGRGYMDVDAYQGDPQRYQMQAAFRAKVQASLRARTAVMTELHGHLFRALRQHRQHWESGTSRGSVGDKPSLSVKELSERLYRNGVQPPGPHDLEAALGDLVKGGYIEPAAVYGEWQARR